MNQYKTTCKKGLSGLRLYRREKKLTFHLNKITKEKAKVSLEKKKRSLKRIIRFHFRKNDAILLIGDSLKCLANTKTVC